MQAHDLISELGKTLGIPLSLEGGTCQVLFDEDAVDFELSVNTLYILAEVGSCVDRTDAYERILQANFGGQQTGGATLSLDGDQFMLHLAISEDWTYANFEAGLERFIKALRYWKEWLALPVQASTRNTPQNTFGSMLKI